ncbi:hypothetical protein QVD17_04015 [Tagetes erecta]|uniref:BHLH domain-containing protein n=1 Tax=Tagetes erecta TaxID=13708 RepID=A0AAD8L9D3_TARER|nr:hypothetical protein QVD17_04015 [Tagetes erecta]
MRALEWLRPFVETMAWDYCIVWQFGNDPSRYIEWIGCCCNGSSPSVCRNVKEEIDATKHQLSSLCRDTYIKHSVNSNACKKLANTPFHLPLYSGIHGEVAMSGQPSWNHDSIGTQVLIPVNGGMIELYVSKHVIRDQEMIEALMTQFNIFSQHIEQLKTEGSPNSSNPSSLVTGGSTHVSPTQSIDTQINLLGHAISEEPKITHKTGKDQYQSKNLVTERKRRNRIKDGLFALRALVPKISKMDRASIIGDAIDYIKELQANVQELKEELERLEEDDSESHLDEMEVQVEVHQIGTKDLLLKLVCGEQRGGFQRIIETVNALGLQVLDVNVTTCYGKVLNILKVEAKGKDFAAKNLKDSLVDGLMPRTFDDNPHKA